MSEKDGIPSITGAFDHSPVQVSGTQNITYIAHRPVPSRREAFAALENSQYETAFTTFSTLLVRQADDAEVRLALALCLLRGRHPCRCDSRTLEQVNAHLRVAQRSAPHLPGPRLAFLLLRDAQLFRWNAQRRGPTQEDHRLLCRMKPEPAAMLLKHVPAQESVLWQELARIAVGEKSRTRTATAPAHRSHRPPRKRNRP
ncbi:hypothetical protein ABZ565_15435 [Streptomyces sp. NPDC016469]|uniref:hypothetical protein n=1 Tax=Streptomyces sp. NPDC016469 TaxID=3157191 RepID=UPI0033C3C497